MYEKQFRIWIKFQTFPDFIGLMSRDAETLPGPLAFGHKYMTGVWIFFLESSFKYNIEKRREVSIIKISLKRRIAYLRIYALRQ